MKKNCAFALILSLFIPVLAFSDTIYVPSDQPTIQAGIDSAVNGDTVLVAPGTYVENIDFKGKLIAVKSSDGAEVTVIDGGSPVDPEEASVVRFENGETLDAVLDGFTLTNGKGCYRLVSFDGAGTTSTVDEAFFGAGIFCRTASPTIINNTITQNHMCSNHHSFGAGIAAIEYSAPEIKNNVISSNSNLVYFPTNGDGGGIYCNDYSNPLIDGNTISDNLAGSSGGALWCRKATDMEVMNNVFERNTALVGAGGAIWSASIPLKLKNNQIIDNQAGAYGGAALISGYLGMVTIRNNTIGSNFAWNDGGGLYLSGNGNITVTGNTVFDNHTNINGGGISLKSESEIVISDNEIVDNYANTWGGGIYASYGSGAVVRDNHVFENSAFEGGGIACFNYDLTIEGNCIEENMAENFGGGVFCSSSACPDILKNEIVGNTAIRFGGGIYCDEGTAPLIEANRITHNTTTHVGGGIACHDATPTIVNNVLIKNEAWLYAGGIYTYDCELELANNTIVYCSANNGGGIACYHSTLSMVNSIVWNNIAYKGSEIWVGPYTYPAELSLSYSLVEDDPGSIFVDDDCTLNWGAGMITADPEFVAPGEQDYHLTYNSPCRGSGDNSVAMLPEFDFEGDPRIHQGTVDIGADEFHRHLYYTGNATPGGQVNGKIVGLPGTTPTGLLLGTSIIEPSIQTPWGEFYLQGPLLYVELGTIPAEGILTLSTVIPAMTAAPYDVPMQAVIGNKLSDLCVVEVR